VFQGAVTLDQHLERRPVGHGAVPVGCLVEADSAVEDPARLDAALKHLGQQLS
jgi:hypothetical protein